MRLLIILLLHVFSISLFAGDTLCPAVAFLPLKKGKQPDFSDTTADYSTYRKRSFLLMVNGMYDLQFRDGKRIPDARIISLSVERQTLQITTAFSPATAFKNRIIYDTISYAGERH